MSTIDTVGLTITALISVVGCFSIAGVVALFGAGVVVVLRKEKKDRQFHEEWRRRRW